MITPQDCLFLIAALVIAGFLLKAITFIGQIVLAYVYVTLMDKNDPFWRWRNRK